MKITLSWLEDQNACSEGIDWFKNQNLSNLSEVIYSLMAQNHFNWANWTIVRFMSHKQKVQYAVFAAEQVVGIFEKKYPQDDRPRKAIEAAKAWIKDPSVKNKNAAYAAYAAADAAAYAAAYAADAAADAAAYAAYAAYAAAYAADAAAYAAYAAERDKLRMKILEFGLELLGEKKDG